MANACLSQPVIVIEDKAKVECSVPRSLLSCMAYGLMAVSLGVTLLVAHLAKLLPRRRWQPNGRIVVTGTFYNPGWYLSHITPLARSGVEEVILIVDESQRPIERVRFVCPPRWVAKLLSRAMAKAIWLVIAGVRFRPDLYMGYHILPGACSALIAGRLFGRPACYQMTGGLIEVSGGGAHNESWLMSSLSQPSAFLERLAVAVVRQFDLVVVRGHKAKDFLAERSIDRTVAIITGSISQPLTAASERPFDLVFVGRMTEIKQPMQFVEIVAAVHRDIPSVRATMIGGGPLLDAVQQRAAELQVADCIDILGKCSDVETILSHSKVFVLTSRSEGMSIAMVEAMAAGVVPVVADVGELGDLIRNGANGFLVTPNDTEQHARRIVSLLSDVGLWSRCSAEAVKTATQRSGVDVVSAQWKQSLAEVVDRCAKGKRKGNS